MDRHTLIVHNLTGQDQMFGFLFDAPDAARPRLTPDSDKRERLAADTQVLLECFPPLVCAHSFHSVLVFGTEEGLSRSVTAAVIPDVRLPLVLVERSGHARANVPFDKGVEGTVPFGGLAGSVVLGRCLMTQQETDGKSEKSPETSHYPAILVLAALEASVSYN